MRTRRWSAWALAALVSVAGCGGESESAQSPPTPAVVAVVGADEITAPELDAVIADSRRSWEAEDEEYPDPGTPKYLDLRRQAMEALIARSQREQAAAARGVAVSPTEVERRLDELRRRPGEDDPRTDAELRASIRVGLLEFETYRDVVAALDGPYGDDLQRRRTEAWRRWREHVRREYAPTWFAPGFDPAELPRNVRRHPRPENQRTPAECDLQDGTYTYGELVKLGCAADVGVDAGPGDTVCGDLYLQSSDAGFSAEEADAGYADVVANLAGICVPELGPDDVEVVIGFRR